MYGDGIITVRTRSAPNASTATASTKAGLEGAAATIMKEAMYYGVRCSVIHPGFTDTPMVQAMGADYLAKNKIEAPALIDGDGKVGHAYGAKTTPHCFVIGKDGKLAYDGAIDDKGSKNYVVDAVKALKEGKTVEPATTKPYGCSVKYARK